MFIPQNQVPKAEGNSEELKATERKNTTEIRLSFLQNYISGTFIGCGLPPIN